MTSVLSTNERNSDDSKRPAANPAPLNVKHFYQNKRLATEVSLQGSQHMLLANDTVLAQLGTAGEARMLKVSQTNSVLGARSESAAYSPYGHLAVGQMVALLGFNGQWQDPISQTYPLGNGHRLFHTSIARFLSPDSLSPFGEGGINSYAYCAGDPINFTDPSGQRLLSYNLNIFGRKTSSKPPKNTLTDVKGKVGKILLSTKSADTKNIKINKQLDRIDSAVDELDIYIDIQSQRKITAENKLAHADNQLQFAEANHFDPEKIARHKVAKKEAKDRVSHYDNKIKAAQTQRSALDEYALELRKPLKPKGPKGMRATPVPF